MWNVDPTWPPPQVVPARPRPHPVAYVFAVVMPLILIAFVAAPLGVVIALQRFGPRSSAVTTPPPVDPGATDGEPGVGDPYYPEAGNGGYDVARYQILINWDPGNEAMTSTTTFSARATHELRSFYVDLALKTDRVLVNGAPATFVKRGFQNVQITPATPIVSGADFQVSVDYSGKPGALKQGDVIPWWTTNAEWTVAGEPESSAWWFPANDHPSDPALMDVSVRVPAGMEALSVGKLESKDTGTEPDFDTWHWIARQPMVPFVNFISIGQFELKEGVEQGRPYVYAVSEQLDAGQRTTAFDNLLSSGRRVSVLESMFGPYPFTELGGVVPAHRLWFDGLETQTRPVYSAGAILSPRLSSGLVTHELAHMWFGDNVTVRQWNDIFNSEAYASWAQWAYDERTGGRTANEAMNRTYDALLDNRDFWRVDLVDPTREHLFDAVYQRGPMALQALRNVIGDDAFFALAREWAQDPGTRTLEDWMARAQGKTQVDLGPFFQTWLRSPEPPARTAANGFR